MTLNVDTKTFVGNDKTYFSFFKGGNQASIDYKQCDTMVIRLLGTLPIGNKAAQLQINSNDPINSQTIINLAATVNAPILFKNIDKIVYDAVIGGIALDTFFTIKNNGNVNLTINRVYVDGPFANDLLFWINLYNLILHLMKKRH